MNVIRGEEMNFGEIIKKKRQLKGYTLADLEKITGKKIANISDLETRRGDNPNLETMRTFADALDLTFQISKGEPLKAWDCYSDIDLSDTLFGIDPQLQEWIKTPSNEPWIRYARMCSTFGPDSDVVKEFKRFLPKVK